MYRRSVRSLVMVALLLSLPSACAMWRGEVRRSGRVARAVITSIEQTGLFINGQPQCELGLRIEPEGEPAFAAHATEIVTLVQIPQFQPGNVLTVRYDVADHSRVVVTALGHVAMDEAGARRAVNEAGALLDALNPPGNGVAATAIVKRLLDSGVSVNGANRLATLEVKVLPVGGAPFDARLVGVFRQDRLAKYQAGNEIHVLYDPADPQRVTFDLARTTNERSQ